MADIVAIKNYFQKLQVAITEEAEFTFFSYKLAKKNVVDDLLCCILALLPGSFKNAMKKGSGSARPLTSVNAYKRMEKLIKRPCPFSTGIYLIKYNEVLALIKAITMSIERDINRLEGY